MKYKHTYIQEKASQWIKELQTCTIANMHKELQTCAIANMHKELQTCTRNCKHAQLHGLSLQLLILLLLTLQADILYEMTKTIREVIAT